MQLNLERGTMITGFRIIRKNVTKFFIAINEFFT